MRGDAIRPAADRGRDARSGAGNPVRDLRPMGAGAVLDGGFELFRQRFGRILALTACLYVPLWLAGVVLALVAPPDASSASPGWPMAAVASSSVLAVPLAGLQLVALSVLGLCVGHLAMELSRGNDPGLRELGALAWRRSWVALLIVPLTGSVHLLTACLGGVGWLLGDALVFVSSTAAGAERLNPWQALLRSISLTRSQYGRALVITFGGLCITQVISWSFSFGPSVLLESLDPGSSLAPVLTAASSGIVLVTEPLTACIAARAYLDLRCRRDGLDLVLRMERRADERSTMVTA